MRTAIAVLVAISVQPPLHAQAQVEAQQEPVSGGRWSMNGRWVNNSEYGTVVAELPDEHIYQICRTKMVGQAGVGTRELRVYVNDQLLPDYSLDHGSCVIARGRKFALRYRGPAVSVQNVLVGHYTPLDEVTFEGIAYARSSFWTMSWVADETQHHDVILIRDVAGEYRICLDNTQAQLTNGQPGFVALRLIVDGRSVQSFGSAVNYRHGNCVDVVASNIHVEMDSWSPSMSYFLVEGTLFRKTGNSSTP